MIARLLDWLTTRLLLRVGTHHRDRGDDWRTLKTNWLYCLLVQVRDDTPEDMRCNAEQATLTFMKHHGVILDLTASLQFVVFGTFGEAKDKCRDDSSAASKELLLSLGNDIRIVAFDGNIAYGIIGADTRFNYTACVPKFDRFLAALLNTEYGRITELGSLP